jgi:hypothetical protein
MAMLMLIANALFALLFALGAAVQYNDPDPLRWMAIYLAAAAVSAMAAIGVPRWPLPAAVGAVALIWAATLAPTVLGQVGLGELFSAWDMESAEIERGREMYGLLIIALWMGVAAFRAWRHGSDAALTTS